MRIFALTVMPALLLLAGCTVGPNYQRPQVPVPANFRAPNQENAPLPSTDAASFTNLKWFEVFHDEQLQHLISVALKQNYDVRDAVSRVEQARANLGTARSNQIPQLSATGEVDFTRVSRTARSPCRPRFLSTRTSTLGKLASTYCHSRLISGDVSDVRLRQLAPICSAPNGTGAQ